MAGSTENREMELGYFTQHKASRNTVLYNKSFRSREWLGPKDLMKDLMVSSTVPVDQSGKRATILSFLTKMPLDKSKTK